MCERAATSVVLSVFSRAIQGTGARRPKRVGLKLAPHVDNCLRAVEHAVKSRVQIARHFTRQAVGCRSGEIPQCS
jgi:hypothetical protein